MADRIRSKRRSFYLKKTKGFVSEAAGNMQKTDLGIALCHFALAAKENAINVCFGMNPMSLVLKGVVKKMDKDYKNKGNIKWNFTKSLIDREGKAAARFEPTESMDHVKAKVEEIL